jgi:endonuclease/exonuclease/phosphatase family metal-dependent hydrolase
VKGLKNIIFLINIIVGLALFLSYMAVFTSPEITVLPSFFALAYPVLLIINAAFVVWWIIVNFKRCLFSLLIIIVGFGHLSRFYQFSGNEIPTEDIESIHVMSYNVQLFGLYNWGINSTIRDSIIDFIGNESPDILCLQEYYYNSKGVFKTSSEILAKLGNLHVNEAFSAQPDRTQNFGMATFLSYPVVNKGKIEFENSFNMAQFTDFIWQNDTIRVYNIHLQSIHFDAENYEDVDDLVISEIDKEKLHRYNGIVKKMTYAFERRAAQSEKVREHIENSPYPVIICGDFNDTQQSYAYHKIAKGFNDCFQDSGKGFGITFQRKKLRMRIDHILCDKNLKSYGFQTKKIEFSDHFPVSCYISRKYIK